MKRNNTEWNRPGRLCRSMKVIVVACVFFMGTNTCPELTRAQHVQRVPFDQNLKRNTNGGLVQVDVIEGLLVLPGAVIEILSLSGTLLIQGEGSLDTGPLGSGFFILRVSQEDYPTEQWQVTKP